MIAEDRVSATNWFGKKDALMELDALKFAVASLVSGLPKGSHEAENASNAVAGIKRRIDFLHDSLRRLLKDTL